MASKALDSTFFLLHLFIQKKPEIIFKHLNVIRRFSLLYDQEWF